MAYLKPQTPLKDLNSGDYFYPLTTIDQIITGTSRLSAFMSEDSNNHNLLNLSNIGNITGNIILNGTAYISGYANVCKIYNSNNYGSSSSVTFNDLALSNGAACGMIYAATNNPTGGASWCHTWSQSWTNGSNANWVSQIALGTQIGTGMWYRCTSGSIVDRTWRRVLDNTHAAIDSGVKLTSAYSWISIAETSSFTCPDGTAITQPGGANPMVLYAGAASARDCGIFYLSNDNAYIANSSDNAYTFGVFDTDITQNFSTEGNASLCVRSNGAGTFVRSRLGVNGINDSYNLYVNGTSYFTGNLNFADDVGIYGIMGGGNDYWRLTGTGTNDAGVLQLTIGDNATTDYFDIIFSDWSGRDIKAIRFGGSSINAYVPLYGAVWNDYAEFRKSDTQEPGYVIAPAEDGIAYKTSVRMQAGARIISDTFGFAVGECDDAKTPVGLAGRVLAYTYQKRSNYKIGDAVCAAPNGTIDIMTREEIQKYPDRIIGIVNEIPDYEIWKSILTHPNGEQTIKEIEVKDRIWIDIK